jgi:hypothetical protein
MSYTLGQAAKATGKSKATIHRAVQSGKLSAVKDEASGAFRIDPAELHRIFPVVSTKHPKNGELRQSETVVETEVIRAQLEQERQERQRERAQLEGTIDDLRQRLDREGEERRKLTAILTDQRAQAIITSPPQPAAQTSAPAKRRWWQRGGQG